MFVQGLLQKWMNVKEFYLLLYSIVLHTTEFSCIILNYTVYSKLFTDC